MKNYHIVAVCLLFMVKGMAQSGNPVRAIPSKSSWSLSLNAGASLPVGAFGEKQLNDRSGLAKTGPVLEFRLQKPLNERAGLAFALGGQYHGFDRKEMEGMLDQAHFYGAIYATTGPVPPQSVPYVMYGNWKVKRSGWWLAMAQAGGYYIIVPAKPESGQIALRALAGAIMAKSPDLEGHSISDTALVTISQESKTGWGFSYTVGADWKKNMGRHYFLTAGLSWNGTSAIKFKDVATQLTSIGYNLNNPPTIAVSRHTGDGRQTINCFQATVGIGLHL